MADRMTIDVDTQGLIDALDAFDDVIQPYLKEAALTTAQAIATEARGRVARRTGATARGIQIEPARVGIGSVVFVGDGRQHVAEFLEFGTKFMTSRPFLFASARVEEGAHDRRMRAAIQQALDDAGWK